ncbi:AAA family ATPase [Roseomonas sp. PWR1]|uniref:AAA family ATPase n=1 Tax=Roseomonas nitratireducens TaxID=2820810 RepID=A0ABS4AR96_9PROT|nr:AAA family ATPase [Neoroseomonas nitratireducens]MBP0463092.1 AAA family ATPase [Neoroseomonas nitratireducens]
MNVVQSPEQALKQAGAKVSTRAPKRDEQEAEAPARKPAPLKLDQLLLEDERAIPERRWVGGIGAFPRPRLACLAGPPGVSKTTLALGLSVALAAGLSYGGLINPPGPCRVLFGGIEDELDELRRRGAAVAGRLLEHPRQRATVNANLAVVDVSDCVPLFQVDHDGRLTETPGLERLRATISEFRPDLVVLDPLIELHTAEENSNTLMRPVLRALRSMGVEFDCVFLLLHHETKAGEGNGLQRIRGAGAIGGAIRSLWSMRPMTAEEAKQFSIAEDMTDLYVKVETGKSQYSRRRPQAWFVAEERELANGDVAHLLVPWSPPTFSITPEDLAKAVRALRQGLHGEPCSTSPTADAAARHALEQAGIPRGACADVLKELQATGEVQIRKWRDPADRKVRKRLWTSGNPFGGWVEEAGSDEARH